MRYQVMNLGSRMGASKGASSPSYGTLCQHARDFKDAVDNSRGRDAIEVAAQAYNNAFDNAVKNNESFYDIQVAIEQDCGVPWAYLRDLRPNGLLNPYTNEYFGPEGYGPPGSHRGPVETGGNNPFKPQGVKGRPDVATEGRPPQAPAGGSTSEDIDYSMPGSGSGQVPPMGPTYAPVATGGSSGNAHDYEEQAAEYSQKQREFEEARRKSQEEADAQIKASNASRDAAEEALRKKYESGDPNAVCGPGEFWDGRQCRGSVSGNFGNLMNTAFGGGGGTSMPGTVAAPSFMGRGPSGMPTGAVPFGMGGRIPTQPLMTGRF